MTERTDILLDDQGDLACENGDLVTGPSDNQHVEDILYSYPGDYKQFPMLGVSIRNAINGSLTGEMKNKISINLENDGYRTINLDKDEEAMNGQPDQLIINIDFEPK